MNLRAYTNSFLILLSFLILSSSAIANTDSDNPFLSDLETQLFNHTNTQLSLNDRLSKIETIVLGYSSNHDSIEIRIARLKGLLGNDSSFNEQSNTDPNFYNRNDFTNNKLSSNNDASNVIDIKANRNKVNSFFQPDINKSAQNQFQNKDRLEDKTVDNTYQSVPQDQQQYQDPYSDQEVEDYPAVSLLESKVFNKTYKGEDISKRLDRLEKNVLNSNSSNLDLSERLDNLKTAILGNANAPMVTENKDRNADSYANNYSNNNNGNYQNYNYQNGYNNPNYMNPYDYPTGPRHDNITDDPYNGNMRYNNSSTTENNMNSGQVSMESLQQIVSRMEQQTLGQVFQTDPINVRLDRLEMHVFNKTDPDLTFEDRIERLIAVNAAGETSDPNDLKQINRLRKIQTGLTVGGVLFSILRGFLF